MANKKISELTPKGSALSATDLLEVSVDAGGGTYTTASVTGQEITDLASAGKQDTLVSGTNIKTVNSTSLLGSGNIVITANPSVINASYSDGTIVTGTLVETLSQSLLVPANTFTNGMLEVLCRMTKTGIVGASNMKIYKNTSNTLTGATLIASTGNNPGNNLFNQSIRTFRINSNTLTGFPALTSNTFDYATGIVALSSTTFITSVDNYIIFSITLTNIADSANVSMARLTQYK